MAQCLWGAVKPNSGVGDAEVRSAALAEADGQRTMISYCTKAGHGSRLMPPGTITGAHFVSTANYIQLTGRANLKNMCVVGLRGRPR